MAQAESAEGARGQSCSEATYKGAPGALPEPPSSPCLPCILICLPEWERVELLPACLPARSLDESPQSQRRASHISAPSVLVQVRTAGFKVEGETEKAAALRSHLASWKRALGSSSQC